MSARSPLAPHPPEPLVDKGPNQLVKGGAIARLRPADWVVARLDRHLVRPIYASTPGKRSQGTTLSDTTGDGRRRQHGIPCPHLRVF